MNPLMKLKWSSRLYFMKENNLIRHMHTKLLKMNNLIYYTDEWHILLFVAFSTQDK